MAVGGTDTLSGDRSGTAKGNGKGKSNRRPEDEEPMNFHPMATELLAEFMHTLKAAAVIDCTANDMRLATLCVEKKVPYFGFCFTDEHVAACNDFLLKKVIEKFQDESSSLYQATFAELVETIKTAEEDSNKQPSQKQSKKKKKNEAKPKGDPKKTAEPKADPKGKPKAASGKLSRAEQLAALARAEQEADRAIETYASSASIQARPDSGKQEPSESGLVWFRRGGTSTSVALRLSRLRTRRTRTRKARAVSPRTRRTPTSQWSDVSLASNSELLEGAVPKAALGQPLFATTSLVRCPRHPWPRLLQNGLSCCARQLDCLVMFGQVQYLHEKNGKPCHKDTFF